MITQRNDMDSHFYNASSTCHGNMMNDCCRFKGDSCRFLNKLYQIKQPIDICHMSSIVVNLLITICLCKITFQHSIAYISVIIFQIELEFFSSSYFYVLFQNFLVAKSINL